MENAARGAAEVAAKIIAGDGGGHVLIVCGGGNNGGDGLAVARHLHNCGVEVKIALANPIKRYTGDALTNLNVVQAMGLALWTAKENKVPAAWGASSLVIDALFGTGLSSAPRDPRWIEFMNGQSAPVLAIDLPSGLDCDTGEPLGACVKAARTVTFVAEKAGFANPKSKHYTGVVTVAEIGCPRELVEEIAAGGAKMKLQ